MIYFKNSNNRVFAYNQEDIDHDAEVKAAIANLEQQIQDLQDSGDDGVDDQIATLREEITRLEASLRISDELVQITEQEKDDIVNPPPSVDEQFQVEMDALNAQYDRDMIEATNKYNVAVARDGSTETEKVNDARAWIADLDAQYDADQLAILNKYYGE